MLVAVVGVIVGGTWCLRLADFEGVTLKFGCLLFEHSSTCEASCAASMRTTK